MARTHEVVKSLTLKSLHNNKCYGEIWEEEQGAHKELQDQDPRGSPHIEEKVIGGDVDLDLLSLFLQEQARIIGGIESKQALRMSTMEVEQELNG